MDKLMRSWWALAVPAAAILALLAAIGLPTLFPALRAPWVRLALIALVALCLIGAALWGRFRDRRASDKLAGTLAEPTAAEAEEQALGARLRDALARLKSQAGGRRDYLYQRPWYVIIGPPGAGKTTALTHSGIRFPWTDTAVQGIGGTRNIDFWFADEAILVDTAGRYTTQDSDNVADAAGWQRILHLLRRTRPLEPINGVIVAFPLDELVRADRAELDAHVTAIRRRLAELAELLQVSVPLYLLLTKADLVAGFTEFFGDLSAEGRRAVLGGTLDPAGRADAPALMAAFDRIVEALWARSPKRLNEEPDQRGRGLILAFPAQVTALRTRLAYLVEGAFRQDRETSPTLRGFYLGSGTQSGTPFDGVVSAMASVYDAPHPLVRPGQGRAYFLNRLLTEVIFPEAGMVRPSAAVRWRWRSAMVGATAAIGAVTLVTTGLWANAFVNNRRLQDALLVAARSASEEARRAGIDLVEVRESDPDLEQALPILNRLRALPRGFSDQAAGSPPWTMRLGLFQSGHADTARHAYLEMLQRVMLPRLLLHAEQAMREQQQPAALYAPLKAYLMLGGMGPLDRGAVRAWVLDDWRTVSLAGSDRADVRTQLARHLDAMLADPDLGRVWQGRRAPLDGTLIASTRLALQRLPLADRAYAVLRQRAAAAGRPDWRADGVLASGDRQAFRNGDAVLAATIPWFFTHAGYAQAYRPGLRDVQAELDRDLWVLGPDAAKRSIRDQLPAMRGAVAAEYARDYIAAWDAMLKTPQPADYFQNTAALGAITRTPSPLKVLLLETARNTWLGNDGGRAAAGQIDAGGEIAAHFRPIVEFGGRDAGSEAPIDSLLKAIRQAAVANSASRVPGAALSGGGGAVQAQLATAIGELSTAGVTAPPQLKSFVDQATRSGAGAAQRSARASIEGEYLTRILPVCAQASSGRYPFAAGAGLEASPADLQRVYGANGELDAFARDRLAPLLDTSGRIWRWDGGDPVASGLVPASAAQFQKAAALRDLLAAGLALNVGVDMLGSGVTAVEFATGGTTYRFDAGNRGPKPVLWNLSVLPAAALVVFSGDREVRRLETRGSFAMFRLIDKAELENAGPARVRARFSSGAEGVALTIDLPSGNSPFGRGGPFSFRCPPRL
ncbi:type VI secretion system membrane subunit TssM [Sphingomonas sp. DT-51]|uniref:type VI secretion system membrane subunit TssM n=1 Tax=Sphingomonas sp. DT-51 TaxID=3396165 RepID=UPI003F1AE416